MDKKDVGLALNSLMLEVRKKNNIPYCRTLPCEQIITFIF